MNNIHANPVGIIKKDIYKITNLVNGKIYIGQAKNTKQRFKKHCIAQESLIDLAIQKYGKENFIVEILESQIENYNEREKYWIKKLNSQTPIGYNITEGGEEPPTYYGIDCPTASIKTNEKLTALKNDLKYTQKSFSQIAKEYNTNKKTVFRINQGISYVNLKDSYPLRKNPNINGKLTEAQVDEIIEILKYSYRQYEDISCQYNVKISTIKDINRGKTHHRKNIDYPIRDYKNSGCPSVTYEQVTEIIELLLYSNKSMRAIAKEYSISHNTVQGINNGKMKRYKRKEYKYPLR